MKIVSKYNELFASYSNQIEDSNIFYTSNSQHNGVNKFRVYRKSITLSGADKFKMIFIADLVNIFCTMTVLKNVSIQDYASCMKYIKHINVALLNAAGSRNIISYQNTTVGSSIKTFFNKSEIFIKLTNQNTHYGIARQQVFLSDYMKSKDYDTYKNNVTFNLNRGKVQRQKDYLENATLLSSEYINFDNILETLLIQNINNIPKYKQAGYQLGVKAFYNMLKTKLNG